MASIMSPPLTPPHEWTVAPTSGKELGGAADEVAEDLLALFGEHRLRVELKAVGRVPGVPQAHHDAVVRPGRHQKLGGDARPPDDQRVVASRLERLAHAGEHTRVVVVDPGGLAV